MDLNQSGINKKQLKGNERGKGVWCGWDRRRGRGVCERWRRRKEKHSDSLTGKVPLDG
jgi:hypothetical protein